MREQDRPIFFSLQNEAGALYLVFAAKSWETVSFLSIYEKSIAQQIVKINKWFSLETVLLLSSVLILSWVDFQDKCQNSHNDVQNHTAEISTFDIGASVENCMTDINEIYGHKIAEA